LRQPPCAPEVPLRPVAAYHAIEKRTFANFSANGGSSLNRELSARLYVLRSVIKPGAGRRPCFTGASTTVSKSRLLWTGAFLTRDERRRDGTHATANGALDAWRPTGVDTQQTSAADVFSLNASAAQVTWGPSYSFQRRNLVPSGHVARATPCRLLVPSLAVPWKRNNLRRALCVRR
jgi:hypothetical protein